MKFMVSRLVTALTLVLLAVGAIAEAQQPVRVARIGVLSPADSVSEPSLWFEAFRRELRERGWVEGKNIAIEWRSAEGRNDRLPDLAAELVRLKVDVIFAVNTPATQAARHATSTVPIVFTGVGNVTATRLVGSLARPGGNVTGVTTMSGELSGKRLELMKAVLPKITGVAVLWDARNEGAAASFREMEVAGVQRGLRIQNVGVSGPDEIQGAFEAAARGRAGALVLIDGLVISSHRKRILELAAKSRLPVVSIYRDFADVGGLLAYGPSAPGMYQRAAYFIDKILKGAKPIDLPVEQPSKFELVINLRTAKALGLTIPRSVLVRADQVLE